MIVPNHILFAEIIPLLRSGAEVTLRAKGRSMLPYIRPDKDSLVLVNADPDCLKVGDSVLALTTAGHYVMHRIKRIDGEMVTLKGDGNFRGTELARRSEVYGLLVALVRDGRRIDCLTPGQRFKALVLRRLWHLRLLAGHIFRKVFPRR